MGFESEHLADRPAAAGFPKVALLTGGGDRPYALGLAMGLARMGVILDFIGSDFLRNQELERLPTVRFLNLRGDMSADASAFAKALRVARYYARLLWYAATSDAGVFHLLWNNRFEFLDRTVLMLFYRLLGKRMIMTVHNVNAAQRDGSDSAWNRWSLRVQYRLCEHLFVHTASMARALQDEFGVEAGRVTVIPFGINQTVPSTDLGMREARGRLALPGDGKVLLFFGNIAPYKGLEYLVEAMALLERRVPDVVLVVAGRPKGAETYWTKLDSRVDALGLRDRVLCHIEYIPDEAIEVYFKAADAFVLPYKEVFQSGVLFLGFNFGVPAIVTRVGELEEDVQEGVNGCLCEPADARSLADAIERFYLGRLHAEGAAGRAAIRDAAIRRHSWAGIVSVIGDVYRG